MKETWLKYNEQPLKARLALLKFYANHIDPRGYHWRNFVSQLGNDSVEFLLRTKENGTSFLCGAKQRL